VRHRRKTFSVVAKANGRAILAKVVAPRLLNCCAVGGIIGKLSFDRDETLACPILDGRGGARLRPNSRSNTPWSGRLGEPREQRMRQ
jgi:hypothetical protein